MLLIDVDIENRWPTIHLNATNWMIKLVGLPMFPDIFLHTMELMNGQTGCLQFADALTCVWDAMKLCYVEDIIRAHPFSKKHLVYNTNTYIWMVERTNIWIFRPLQSLYLGSSQPVYQLLDTEKHSRITGQVQTNPPQAYHNPIRPAHNFS